MLIVNANPNVVPLLLPMLKRMHMESGLDLPPLDEEKVLATLAYCSPVFVAFEGDTPIGVLALKEVEHWFSRDKFLGDLVFYVDSAYRNSRAGYYLLRSAREYAIMAGLPLMMAVVDANDVDRKDQFFQRLGFLRAGGVYTVGL